MPKVKMTVGNLLTMEYKWSRMIGGVSMLAGIGFTVSLFIANLSFGSMGVHGHELLNDAKLGILVGSLLSGLLGYTYLSRVLPKSVEEDED